MLQASVQEATAGLLADPNSFKVMNGVLSLLFLHLKLTLDNSVTMY